MNLLLALFLLAPPALALTNFGTPTNQTVVASTSGIIGSISPGNTVGKTAVWASSSAATSANGMSVVLSSRTTTAGKTFYLQHFDAMGYLAVGSSTTIVNLGSLVLMTPSGVKVASMTFMGGQSLSVPWTMEFAEPLPISAGMVIASSATANTASIVTWMTNFVGYEK